MKWKPSSLLDCHVLIAAEILGPEVDLTGVQIDEDVAGMELQMALNKTRKLKRRKDNAPEKVVASKVLARPAAEASDHEEDVDGEAQPGGLNIVLNSTSEFCRALGEIPTYGMAGNRVEDEDELMVSGLLMEQARRVCRHKSLLYYGWSPAILSSIQ